MPKQAAYSDYSGALKPGQQDMTARKPRSAYTDPDIDDMADEQQEKKQKPVNDKSSNSKTDEAKLKAAAALLLQHKKRKEPSSERSGKDEKQDSNSGEPVSKKNKTA